MTLLSKNPVQIIQMNLTFWQEPWNALVLVETFHYVTLHFTVGVRIFLTYNIRIDLRNKSF